MFGIGRHFSPFVCFAASLAGSLMYGQTITISPAGYITAGPGGTQQFSAVETGNSVMGSTVIWSAGGKAGGNSVAGTISSSGLYTAPTVLPASGQVQITATLNGNSKVSASTYIYLLPAGPTITSVSPNPIPVGTDTITLTGSGFQKGGVILVGILIVIIMAVIMIVQRKRLQRDLQMAMDNQARAPASSGGARNAPAVRPYADVNRETR